MRALAAMAALIGIVVMSGVHAHARFPIRQIIEAEREFNVSLDAKSVLIGDMPPHMEALPNADFDLLNFNIGINFGDDGRQDFMKSWTDDANASMGERIGQWKSKIVRQRVRENICGGTENDLIRWRIAVIEQHDTRLKADASCAVLRNYSVENSSQVGAALQLCDKSLSIRNLTIDPYRDFDVFDVFGHRSRDAFHCDGSTAGLCDGVLHVIGLTGRDFVHFLDGRFKTASLDPEHYGLNQTDKRDDSRKFDHPPIGRRFIISLGLVLGGFFCGLRGWENAHHKRRVVGATLIGCGLLLSALGYWFWLSF